MSDTPTTRPSLLLRVRHADNAQAWNEFVDVYASLIHRYLTNRGVQDADAADLAQEVLLSVAKAIGRFDYDRQIGTFRGWLQTVTRNKLRTFLSSRKRHPRGTGDTNLLGLLAQAPSREEQNHWEHEYEQRLFDWAADKVKDRFEESTWRAFWMTSVDGLEAPLVAKRLSMSVGAVYIAKSRVTARLREQIERIGDR